MGTTGTLGRVQGTTPLGAMGTMGTMAPRLWVPKAPWPPLSGGGNTLSRGVAGGVFVYIPPVSLGIVLPGMAPI